MNKKIALAIAALVVAGSTTGFVLASSSDDGVADSGMPVPGAEVDETIVTNDSAGMPVPGAEVDETIVTNDSAGMPVPGFEGSVEETVVEGGTSSGMVVPGFEGQIDDTAVEVSP